MSNVTLPDLPVAAALSGTEVLGLSQSGTTSKVLLSTLSQYVLSVTAGIVAYFAQATAPTGWLKANGAVLLIADYPALSANLYCGDGLNATAEFGFKTSDSGGTTRDTAGSYIVLPDLRGEFIRGYHDGDSADPDYTTRAFGAAQAADNAPHSHTTAYGQASNASSGCYGVPGSGATGGSCGSTTSSTVGSEARPRNIALLACIRY